jgi:hypothetical protein
MSPPAIHLSSVWKSLKQDIFDLEVVLCLLEEVSVSISNPVCSFK